MGFGNCVIANGTIENLEVIGDAALSYPFNNHAALSRMMQQLLDNPAMVRLYRAKARERIAQNYSWDQVTTSYETLFQRFVKAKPSPTGVSAIIAINPNLPFKKDSTAISLAAFITAGMMPFRAMAL